MVAKDHVLRGVQESIAQLGHGKHAPLARLQPDDWLVYYSPRQSYPNGDALRAFTAIGRVAANEIYEVETSAGFHMSRRKVEYLPAHDAPIAPLLPFLSFSRDTTNWGMVMRRGLVSITDEDLSLITEAMGVEVR